MKNLLLLVTAFLIFWNANAQTNITKKKLIGVTRFMYTQEFTQAEAVTLRNAIIAKLSSTGRVEVLDPSTINDVDEAREMNKSEGALTADELSDEMQPSAYNKHVSQILTGSLDNVKITKSNSRDYKTGGYKTVWNAEVNYTLELTDVTSRSVIFTKQYSCRGSDSYSQDAARKDAINKNYNNINRFVQDCFPLKGYIIALDEIKGKKAKTVYINLGTDYGINNGQKFDVFKIIDIAGEKSQKAIGTITVSEVMGANRAFCKVNDGAEEILNEMKKNAKIPIKSRATHYLFNIDKFGNK